MIDLMHHLICLDDQKSQTIHLEEGMKSANNEISAFFISLKCKNRLYHSLFTPPNMAKYLRFGRLSKTVDIP